MRWFKVLLQAIFSTVILFVVLEILCWGLGVPKGSSEFAELIILKEKLSIRKAKDEIRIFAYGESTMHGAQYAPASSPTKWLDLYLKDYLPNKKVKFVNFARMGKGANFAYDLFQDTIQYQPDYALFYLGHNVFLPGARKDEVLKQRAGMSYQMRSLVKQSRFISFVLRISIKIKMKRDAAKPADFMGGEKIETPPHGLEHAPRVSRRDPFYLENIAFFKSKLMQILDLAEKNKIPVMFFKPVGNLKDFPPSFSEHQKHLSQEDLAQWNLYFENGIKALSDLNFQQALRNFQSAYALDSGHADLAYQMAKIYFQTGEFAQAKLLFEEARDYDVATVRAPKEVIAVYEQLPKEKFLFIDTEAILTPMAPGGILGDPVVEDNVHFSIPAHSEIARTVARTMAGHNWIAPYAEWNFQSEKSFQAMSDLLGVNKQTFVEAYGRVANYLGSRFDTRILYAQKAVNIDPENPITLRFLAWAYWVAEQKDKAMDIYQSLNQIDPSALQEVFKTQPAIKEYYANYQPH